LIISGFEATKAYQSFSKEHQRLMQAAAYFGAALLVFMGTKTTMTKPTNPAECAGVDYNTWRIAFSGNWQSYRRLAAV